jgi:hypothetical protein
MASEFLANRVDFDSATDFDRQDSLVCGEASPDCSSSPKACRNRVLGGTPVVDE